LPVTADELSAGCDSEKIDFSARRRTNVHSEIANSQLFLAPLAIG
jgi:hypothetical protein